jgi:hypothetical protein
VPDSLHSALVWEHIDHPLGSVDVNACRTLAYAREPGFYQGITGLPRRRSRPLMWCRYTGISILGGSAEHGWGMSLAYPQERCG